MSKSRTLRIGTAALAAATVLSACASGNGSAASSPTSSAPATTVGKAPKVAAALPVDELLADPCTGALSPAQMRDLGMAAPGKSSKDQFGPSCIWKGIVNTSNSISISPLPVNKGGMSDIYANNDDKKYAYFVPVTVDGYPGAYAEPADGRANGFCSVWVGVTDQLAVMVGAILLEGSNKAHPCDSTNKVGTAMIEHLKGAA